MKKTFQHHNLMVILGIFLVAVYCFAGIRTETDFIRIANTPNLYMFDFKIYERALQDVLALRNPYQETHIGIAFLYPPPSLLLIQLFALVPDSIRYILLGGFDLALLLLVIFLIQRAYQIPISQSWWWYPAAVFFAPTLETLIIGQINFFSLAGIAVLFLCQKKHPVLAGLGLCFAVITKMSPLLLFGYLVFQRRWRVILWAAGSIACVSILTGLLYGFQHFGAFFESFLLASKYFQVDYNLQSLGAKLGIAGLDPSNFIIPFQLALSIYFGILLLVSAVLAHVTKENEPFFMVSIFAMTLYPNILWYHHYVFLLLPAFILLAWSRQHIYAVTWVVVFLFITQVDRFRWTTGLLIHLMGHIAIIGLLAYQVKQAFSNPRKEHEPAVLSPAGNRTDPG